MVAMFPTRDFWTIAGIALCAIGFLLMVYDVGWTWISASMLGLLIVTVSLELYSHPSTTMLAIIAIVFGGVVLIMSIPAGVSWIILAGAALAIVCGGYALYRQRKIGASVEG